MSKFYTNDPKSKATNKWQDTIPAPDETLKIPSSPNSTVRDCTYSRPIENILAPQVVLEIASIINPDNKSNRILKHRREDLPRSQRPTRPFN